MLIKFEKAFSISFLSAPFFNYNTILSLFIKYTILSWFNRNSSDDPV